MHSSSAVSFRGALLLLLTCWSLQAQIIALGAPEQVVIFMIMRETGWLLVIGFFAGLALTFPTIRLISSRLYGLTPTDPAALAFAIVLLALVALLAAWLPAHRASRVNPLLALRHE